jgi:hypothetical protein
MNKSDLFLKKKTALPVVGANDLFQYDTRVLEREWQANKRPGYDSK